MKKLSTYITNEDLFDDVEKDGPTHLIGQSIGELKITSIDGWTIHFESKSKHAVLLIADLERFCFKEHVTNITISGPDELSIQVLKDKVISDKQIHIDAGNSNVQLCYACKQLGRISIKTKGSIEISYPPAIWKRWKQLTWTNIQLTAKEIIYRGEFEEVPEFVDSKWSCDKFTLVTYVVNTLGIYKFFEPNELGKKKFHETFEIVKSKEYSWHLTSNGRIIPYSM